MPAHRDDPVVVAVDTSTEAYTLGRRTRRALAGVALGAVLAAVAAALLLRGGDDPERGARDQPPSSATFPLTGMRPLATCAAPAAERLPARTFRGIALLGRRPRAGDRLPLAPGALPIEHFDAAAVRGVERRGAVVHVVPSTGVAADDRCSGDAGPGVCLVVDAREFACFPIADVRGGRALAVTSGSTVVGLLPDGIDRMTLAASGPSRTAAVVDNVVALDFGEAAGVHALAVFHRTGGCPRAVAPALLDRVALLRGLPQPGRKLPGPAHDALAQWSWWLDIVVEDGARFWGRDGDVGFWAVPVVPSGEPRCAPATRVCVVAVGSRGAGAHCAVGRDRDGEDWIVVGAGRRGSLLYGVVPDGVTGARVRSGGATVRVPARRNVIGGVLPFRWRDAHVRLLRGHNRAPED